MTSKITRRWRQRRVRTGQTTTARLDQEFARLDLPGALVKLPFGKHEGQELATVPPSYLKWLMRTVDGYGELKQAIAGHLKALPNRKRRRRSRGRQNRT